MKTKIFFTLAIILVIVFLVSFFSSPEETEAPAEDIVFTQEVFSEKVSVDVQRADSNAQTTEAYIQDRFSQLLTDEAYANRWTVFTDVGRTIPLRTVLDALDANIEPSLEALLDQNQWQFYRCYDPTSAEQSSDIVLSTYFSLQRNYQGNLYKDQMQFLRTWEQSLLEDVAPIIFPAAYYGSQPELYSWFATDADNQHVELRLAAVRFADGTIKDFGYLFVGDELLVGSNINCLLFTQQLLFDTNA